MDASVKPEEESSDNELCRPTMAEVLAENARLREENENLKAEMTMKDQRSDKVEDELRETIVTLDRITRKHGGAREPEALTNLQTTVPVADSMGEEEKQEARDGEGADITPKEEAAKKQIKTETQV